MKFVIATQELNYLINKCLNAVAQKSTIPILSNFLIEAINNELIITATDLTVGVRCFTEAKILEEGSTTLPAKRLAQLIRELTAMNVEITTSENEITEINAQTSRFKLNGMNKNEFPALPNVTDAVHFKIKQKILKDMLYRTAFAVSREDNRYVLTGVCLQVQGGTASFIGTDGKRLAKSQTTLNIDPSFQGTYVIPLKAVEEILKNLEEEGEAIVFLMQDKIAIKASNTTIISKLLAGEYPDVNRVIPSQTGITVNLHREELMTLLRQISLFAAENNHSVRFTFDEGELKLTANTMEIGEGKVSMPVNYKGEKLEIAFNPHFFLDILRHSKNETISLGITDPYNPGLISDFNYDQNEEEKESEQSSLFVLMPMRLSED
ncbi:DNA polymerase III subunit beta [Neochlamydia sp. TUME1]|uniref:DNA polymerase III subunit beta n=1 Tax=Neochlamydia sp. TUME1 TaxID=1478174 RepID=UPI00058031B5|nr:DNA polymerase III subunit beta [Neochlamydia sp. TUME1]KIC75734.1 DNA polymerase III subunit beta [Neochlamydia sp. TUME1]